MGEAPSNPPEGRDETELERNDRNLAAMGFTMVGVVMLLSDIAFSPAVTALITAVAVIACSILWYVMPLARRRAFSGGSPLPDSHRLDAVLADRFDADREPVR